MAYCDFGYALQHLRAGRRVWRKGWKQGSWLQISNGKILLRAVDGTLVPYMLLSEEILAEDWQSSYDEE